MIGPRWPANSQAFRLLIDSLPALIHSALNADSVAELKTLFRSDAEGCRIVLDLKD